MLISDFSKLASLIDAKALHNLYYYKPISCFSIDSRSIKKGCAFIALKGQHKDGHEYIHDAVKNGACAIIAQHDIPDRPKVPFYIVEDTYEAIKKVCRYMLKIKKPLLCAITGSVGKTTTKEMLWFILNYDGFVLKNYKTENNLLGVTKTIFSLANESTVVLELGTNHPGELGELSQILRPQIGVITFVKPVHLEGFKNLDGVYKEKISLLASNPRMKAVLNGDDKYLRKVGSFKKAFWFGLSRANDIRAKIIKSSQDQSVFLVNDTYILMLASPFEGFIYNALAALAASTLMGVDLKVAVSRLSRFTEFPSQRVQIIKTDDFLYINDAYNSNPYSFEQTLKLLDRYHQPKMAVIGDMLELGEKTIYYHRQLAHAVKARDFDYVFTVGEYTPYLVEALKGTGFKNVLHCASSQAVARGIKQRAKKGQLIFMKGSRKMELEKVMSYLEQRG